MKIVIAIVTGLALVGCGFPALFETMVERGDSEQDIEDCETICGLDEVLEADHTYGRRLHCQCKEDKCPVQEPCPEGGERK